MNKRFNGTGRKRTALLAALLMGVLSLSSCFLYGPTNKKLTTYFTESKVVSARFFTGARDTAECEELDPQQVDALVAKLDSMDLTTKFAHTDYYWAGQYGVELSYEDGTYLVYDGTKLYQRKVSVKEKSFTSDDHLHSEFVSVTNMKFWDEMRAFFPKISEIF